MGENSELNHLGDGECIIQEFLYEFLIRSVVNPILASNFWVVVISSIITSPMLGELYCNFYFFYDIKWKEARIIETRERMKNMLI